MPLHFKKLSSVAHQAQVDNVAAQLHTIKSRWGELDLQSFTSWIRRLDPRLDCESGQDRRSWVIRYSHPSVVPLAHWVASALPDDRRISVGRPAGSLDAALGEARRLGVDLSSSRVRVGFSRGHLLEIYVFVPLDVDVAADLLQFSAEIFLETLLGDAIMDDWVGTVDVDRIARSKGLLVLADSRSSTVSYPLSEVRDLVERGIAALTEELPDSIIRSRLEAADWTALTIDETNDCESDDLPQPDRCFATTRFPEALKACLQGLPFCSARFCRGEEIWISLSWTAQRAESRAQLREQVEAILSDSSPHSGPVRAGFDFLLGGTGFGIERDYVDLWVRNDELTIGAVATMVAQLTKAVRLEFYDTKWREEGCVFSCF